MILMLVTGNSRCQELLKGIFFCLSRVYTEGILYSIMVYFMMNIMTNKTNRNNQSVCFAFKVDREKVDCFFNEEKHWYVLFHANDKFYDT